MTAAPSSWPPASGVRPLTSCRDPTDLGPGPSPALAVAAFLCSPFRSLFCSNTLPCDFAASEPMQWIMYGAREILIERTFLAISDGDAISDGAVHESIIRPILI